MSWVVIASQSGMGGQRMRVGPFEDRALAEQAILTLLLQQDVGAEHDTWDSVELKEVNERD